MHIQKYVCVNLDIRYLDLMLSKLLNCSATKTAQGRTYLGKEKRRGIRNGYGTCICIITVSTIILYSACITNRPYSINMYIHMYVGIYMYMYMCLHTCINIFSVVHTASMLSR